MALKTPQCAVSVSRQALRHYRSRNVSSVTRPLASTCPRTFTTSASRPSEAYAEEPRWNHTPPRMKAPFSPHITVFPERSKWEVNEDPEKLDNALNTFLGRDNAKILPEELKWLAVTHKSFDQGRRGFNDRLAFLGRQICTLEAMESILTSTPDPKAMAADLYAEKRQPFTNPALRSLDNLSATQPNSVFTMEKLVRLAVDTGLSEVIRWKARIPDNPKGSGFGTVMSATVYAIVGAVALQNGGKVASRIVRERIMKKIR